jgi:hypothetical protein
MKNLLDAVEILVWCNTSITYSAASHLLAQVDRNNPGQLLDGVTAN